VLPQKTRQRAPTYRILSGVIISTKTPPRRYPRGARSLARGPTEHNPGNASSPHQIGGRANGRAQGGREKLAAFLGCQPADIVWTSGATEANNMSCTTSRGTLDAKSEVWFSAIEHPCVTNRQKTLLWQRAKFILSHTFTDGSGDTRRTRAMPATETVSPDLSLLPSNTRAG